MMTNPKIVSVICAAFVLGFGLPYAKAAHPQAETHPTDDRGSQGNQNKIKGDSLPGKVSQGDETVDETKLKESKRQEKREFDEKNAKGQNELHDASKVPLRTMQNK